MFLYCAFLLSQVFQHMKKEDPERYMKLEHLCSRTFFDPRDVYAVSASLPSVAGNLEYSCEVKGIEEWKEVRPWPQKS